MYSDPVGLRDLCLFDQLVPQWQSNQEFPNSEQAISQPLFNVPDPLQIHSFNCSNFNFPNEENLLKSSLCGGRVMFYSRFPLSSYHFLGRRRTRVRRRVAHQQSEP